MPLPAAPDIAERTTTCRSTWSGRLARLLGAAAAIGVAACSPSPAPPSVQDFLARHWAEPIAPQGAPPAGYSALEASLSPAACGQCHPVQWADWQGSLHARAMGPGIRWQLQLMDQAAANRCVRCHAPLAEQKALLAIEHGWPAAPSQPPPAYVDAGLAHEGLVCAACHVRGHRRYGPPARPAAADRDAALAHGGFVESPAFGDSRFCAHCHQFPDDGPRTAGKLHEDTYAQWQASAYAPERSCQSCHMPDRRHRWRGIHDPETTRDAIDVQLQVQPLVPGRYEARAEVRNTGAGHHFPTYMVPKVELQFVRVDATGGESPIGRHVIGWTVDTAITREIDDTRIPAGASAQFVVPFEAPSGAGWTVELRIVVKPGEHYERTFRDSLSRADRLPPAAVPLLREALQRVVDAQYELMRVRRAPAG
ncbi:MAG: multiheme c-type cytochrome [Gammaproteobacteria bacterium]